MRHALIPLLFLSACAAGGPVYIKPGTAAFQAEQDFLSCAAKAQSDFPVAERIATAPRITLGGGYCRDNVCLGVNNYPDIYSYDRNDDLRRRSLAACMTGKGYVRTNLPGCPSGTRGRVLQTQPLDTRGLCQIDGRIVDPA
ncbi:MAG: hypothetical protein AAF919_09115 [Pseudomonadota bacterium]